MLLFIPLLQLSLLCLRRARRSGCTWRSVRSSQLCRMSQAGSTRPGTLVTENKSQEEHSGSVQPSGQRTSASCEIRATLPWSVCCCFPTTASLDCEIRIQLFSKLFSHWHITIFPLAKETLTVSGEQRGSSQKFLL